METEPQRKGFGTSEGNIEGPDAIAKVCNECYRTKENCHLSHCQALSVSVQAAPALCAELEARSSPPSSHLATLTFAPFRAFQNSIGSTLSQPSNVTQVPPASGALNTFGLQPSIPSLSAGVLNLGTREALPLISLNEPIFQSPAPITSAGTGPYRIVTLRVNAANVPAHLKAMPSQGTPNGSTSAPAPAPVPTAAASRAASAAPTPSAMPTEAAEHGAATRVYMNSKVTYHLLAGMKELAKNKSVVPCY